MSITVDDVKLLLKINNITTSLSDDEIEKYIEFVKNELCSILGITLEPVNHTYSVYFKNLWKHLTLPVTNCIEVSKVVVKDFHGVRELDEDDYWVELENSIIHLKRPHKHFNSTITVEYVTQFPDDFLAKFDSLLLDLVADGLSPTASGSKGISSIKEGDVTVDYDENSSDYGVKDKIDDMKNELEKYIYRNTVMMI